MSDDAPAADQHEAGPALHIRLLGEPVWQCPGSPAVRLSPKDAALLAKLALDGPQARAALYELIWPEAGSEKAGASLRQRISRLHRAAGRRVVESSENVRLHPGVSVDAAQPAALDNETLLAAGTLLAGFDLGEHDELDRWLTHARAQVAEACAQVLADRAQALEQDGRLRDALPLARRIVELLPLAEHGWRRLMRLHYLRNDRAAAQEAFWRLTALLRDELGIRPSAETLQLMQTVEAAESARVLPQRPVPASVLRPPVLVGRTPAWQAMSEAWQRAQPFLLVADAGLGKSRLLEEFLQGRAGVVGLRAQPGDEQAPYALLGRVLVQVEREFAPLLPAELRAELARLRPEFGRPPEAPAHPPVLWHAVEQLLAGAVARGLQALALDDLHNTDPATLEALRWLGASPTMGTLRLALATRPRAADAAGSPLAAWLEDSQRPVRIELQPLTPPELNELLVSLALPTLLDADLATQLFRHAGGHPLFTLATLQDALARGGDLRGAHLPRPGSVQALLDARLRDLPAAARDLLRVAAVAGADLTVDRAAQLLDCPVLALVDTWALLEAANVLRGEAFSHDLVHEAALRSVPQGVRQSLHRRLAGILAEDPAAPAARVAWHWEQGERWAEAGRCWHAAGEAARRSGRLDEQIELLERAARCHERAGDPAARFESLHARLAGLQLRHGGAAVIAALPAVEALADTGLRRLRCRLARAEAWLDGEHGAQAAAESGLALHEATHYPALQGEAGALHAQALVQCGRFDEALETARRSLAAAEASGLPAQQLHVLNALSYVHYASGRLADAVDWQRRAVALAETLGHRVEAFAGEGNVAALLASVGDVPGTYEHACRTRERHRELGLGDNSTLGSVNHIVLGAAAAALGRFDEALTALQAAVESAGAQAAPAAQAKARLALANLWLTLGRADAARALLDELPAGIVPGMQMQAELVRARAAEQDGLPMQRHLSALARLADGHDKVPLVQSAWFEWSYQGDAAEVVDRLRRVRRECAELGLHGTARSLQWRELVRCLEVEGAHGTAAALELAHDLQPHAATGTSAKCYPPQTWLTLAQAYTRAGEKKRRDECLDSARRWLDAALMHVPAEHRAAFAQRNVVNRRLLADDAG